MNQQSAQQRHVEPHHVYGYAHNIIGDLDVRERLVLPFFKQFALFCAFCTRVFV
jgi:hypothetical protein